MKTYKFLIAILLTAIIGCASAPPPPQWSVPTELSELDYLPYLIPGSATLSGQAFILQVGGGVVKAAGRQVTLDPATESGTEWWYLAGRKWQYRDSIPNSRNFMKARRKVTADAEGRFTFENLPEGSYYVRTEITWQLSPYDIQGGLVGQLVEVKAQGKTDVILSSFTN